MIRSFKHKGLKRLYRNGDRTKVGAALIQKLEWILADLETAKNIEHLRQPGYRLHRLQGNMSGLFAIDVTANWRVVFHFDTGVASEIDLIDYH